MTPTLPHGFFGCYFHPTRSSPPTPVPLLGVHAEGIINDFTAQVTLSQRYKNLETNSIEIEYQFPLDELGAVCEFEAEINGKKVKGNIMDKDRAADKYDDAIAAGHGAYMLKQVDSEIASISIGNLPPNAECLIKITYVTELAPEDDKVHFVLPSTICPSNKSTNNQVAFAPSNAGTVSGKTGFTIDFKLKMASNIKSLSSPSHPLELEFEGKIARVRLAKQVINLEDGDLEIIIGVTEPFTPRLWIEPVINNGKTEYASMAVFFPAIVAPHPKSEFIFVIDRSGSMSGTQIEDARTAMQILLRSIPEGSKFNIVGFGSTFQVMSPQSVDYNATTFAQASQVIATMQADLSSTNLKDPLSWIFRQSADFNYPRQVFILTDGQLDDKQSVLQMVKYCSGHEIHPKVQEAYRQGKCTYSTTASQFVPQHWYQCRTCNMVETLGLCTLCKTTCHNGHDVIGPYFSDFFCDCAVSTTHACKSLHNSCVPPKEVYKSSTRIFSLGIGAGVDRDLVVGLAREGNGTSMFVKTGEKMERKVVAQLKVSIQPSLENVDINWGVKAQQSPTFPPPIFNRSRLIVYATGTEKPTKVTLKAQADCKEVVNSEVRAEEVSDTNHVRKLAAKARIRDLELVNASANKREITDVSVKNSVLSTYTAFVAVEERQDGVEGTMVSRKFVAPPPSAPAPTARYFSAPQASAYTTTASASFLFSAAPTVGAAFGSTPAPRMSAPAYPLASYPTPTASAQPQSFSVHMPAAFASSTQPLKFYSPPAMSAPSPSGSNAPPKQRTPDEAMAELMQLQSFNGSWDCSDAFAKAIKVPISTILAAIPANVSKEIWATALAIAFLEVKLRALAPAWEMAAQKSNTLLANGGFSGLIAIAKNFIQSNNSQV